MERLTEKPTGIYNIKDIVGDMTDIDVETTLALIVAQVVDDLDSAQISITRAHSTTIIELIVAPADRGKLIGRDGHVASALRTVVRAIQGPLSAERSYQISLLDDPIGKKFRR